MCRGTGHGSHTDWDPILAPHGGGRVPQSLQGSVSSGAWKPRSGASRQSPPGRSPPRRGPRVDPALLTTFIFSKIRASGINLMLKCTQAAYFALTILHHMLYVLLGIKCSLLNVFTWFTTLERTLNATHSHGHLEGACKNIQDAAGKVVGVRRARGGKHRLRPCFYLAF